MKKPVSLVLSSGGARGLTHIGAIEALEASGFRITSIAGSSIGTLVGGIYAMGKLPEFKEWLLGLRIRDVFNLMDFTWNGSGMMKGEKVLNKLKTFIPDARIEDFPIPFAAVTTDIIREEEVVFTEGSFYEALRASIAIPAVFTPVRHKDNVLIDGGVLNPLPINHVRRMEGDLLAVVNLNGRCLAPGKDGSKTLHSGYVSLLQQAYFSMRYQLARLAIQYHQPDIVIDVPRNITGVWDYHKADYLITSGRELAQQCIDTYAQESGRALDKSG